jgi:hypothetical protein
VAVGKVRRRAAVVAAAVGVVSLTAAVGPAVAQAPPFTLTTLSAESGYFQLDGKCPKNTTKLRFSWSPSPAGAGYGEISIKAKDPVSLRLRMLSSVASESIDVTIECKTPGGRTRLLHGPLTVTSGNALLPTPPEGTGSGRRVVYSLSAQQLWATEADGSVVNTYLVSGRRLALLGKSSQYGSFKVFSKSRMGCVNGIRCPFMVRFTKTAINNVGFHAIPWSKPKGFWQTPAELGQPRSGGCVRADPVNAEWLFNWTVIGDPVHVVE